MIQTATIEPFIYDKHMDEILNYQEDLYNTNFITKKALPDLRFVDDLYKDSPDIAFVLVDQNKVIGFYIYLPQFHYALLAQIYIAPDYRSKGYGKMLINHFEDQIRQNQFDEYALQVSDMNKHAMQFYEKLGCQIENEIYFCGEKRYEMFKKL